MRILISLISKSLSLGKNILLKIIRKSRTNYTEKKKLEKKSLMIKRYELLDKLKENIGNRVFIQSENQIHLYQNDLSPVDYELKGRILEVDDDWIKLERYPSNYLKARGPDYLYFKTDVIINFTTISDSK